MLRDQELRFVVRDSPDYYNLKLSLFNDDKKTELIGETWIDLGEKVIVRGGGRSDNWFTLNCKGKYAGEVRLELTYYDSRPKPEGWVEKKEKVETSKSGVKRRPLPTNPAGVEAPLAAPKSFGPRTLSHPTAGARQQHALPEHMRELRARRTPQAPSPTQSEVAQEYNGTPEPVDYASSRTPSDPRARAPYPDNMMYNGSDSEHGTPYQYDTPERQSSQSSALPHGLPELPPMDNSRSRFARRSSTSFDQSPGQSSYALTNNQYPAESRTLQRERSGSHLSMQHSRMASQQSCQETELYSPSRQVSQQSYQPPSVQQDYDYQDQDQDYGHDDPYADTTHNQYTNSFAEQPRQHRISALYDRTGSVSYQPAELEGPPPLPPAHRSHGNTPRHDSYDRYEPSQQYEPQQYEEYTPAPLRVGNSRGGTPQRPASRNQQSASDRWPRRRSSLFDDRRASAGATDAAQYPVDDYAGHNAQSSQQLVSPRRLSNYGPSSQVGSTSYENSYIPNSSPYQTNSNGRQYQSATDLSQTLVHRPTQQSREPQRQFFPTGYGQQQEPILTRQNEPYTSHHAPPGQRRTYVPPRPKSMAHLPSQSAGASATPPRSFEPSSGYASSPPVMGQSPGQWGHRNSIGQQATESPYGSVDPRQSRTNDRGTPMRKSISPAPAAEERRTSIVPFGPDSYDELNPNSPSARASSGPNTPARPGYDPYSSREQTKIIDFHGNAIDPSDRLPETSWAPEPEPRGQAKEKAPRDRESLTGARPSPVSARESADGNGRLPPLSVVVRGSPYSNPHTPAESPLSNGTVVRARLAKRNPMQRPHSAILASEDQTYSNIPTPPSNYYNNNSSGYGSPQHSPSHSHGYASPQVSPLRPTYGSQASAPPPVPAKVPFDDEFQPGQLVKAATVGAYGGDFSMGNRPGQDPLSHEIGKIDIGGASGASKGRVRRMFGR